LPSGVRYRRQYRRCGKPNCRTCAGGPGHGPYWYAIWREDGRLKSRYVGKELPQDIRDANPTPADADLVVERVSRGIQAMERKPDIKHVRQRSEETGTVPISGLRVWVLGQFRVELGGVAISDWHRQNAATLFRALLVADRRRLGREYLADLLSTHGATDTARATLATAVHTLRTTIDPARTRHGSSRYIVAEGDTLALRIGTDDWVDLYAFEEALEMAAGSEDPVPALQEAVSAYGGDLLPGETAEWCSVPREALRLRWHSAMLKLAEGQARHNRFDDAESTLGRLLTLDPAEEEAARRLMSLLARHGRRVEALRIFGSLKRTLRLEFRAHPAPETVALASALRQGTPLPRRRATPAAEQGPPRAPTAGPVRAITGRGGEVTRIREHLMSTREGRGQIVVIMGEVGIGKTRLAEEASMLGAMLGFTVTWGRAGEGEHELPYAPFSEAMRAYAAYRPRAALRRELAGAEAATILLPNIAARLGMAPPAPLGNAGAERLRLWTAANAWLIAACESRPLLLILEDLHWADEGSLGLLYYLARRCHDLRLAVVVTARQDIDEGHVIRRIIREGSQNGGVSTIVLEGLTSSDAEDLIHASLGAATSRQLAEVLRAQCGGNPFFMCEILALLQSEHGDTGGSPERLAAILEGGVTLPLTIKQTLTRRLDQVSIECRSLLRAAAVLGLRFRLSLLSVVANLPIDTCEDRLDEAVAASLASGEQDVDGHYRIAHALLQRALYGELLPGQRRRLHLRAATVLAEIASKHEMAYEAIANVESIAYHFARTTEHASAVVWLERSGDRAAAVYAPARAIQHYRAALERLSALAQQPADPAFHISAEIARIEEKTGDLRLLEGDFADAGAHFAGARSHAAAPRMQAELWRKEGVTWEKRGEYERALTALHHAENLAPLNGGASTWDVAAETALCLGEVFYRQGRLQEAMTRAMSVLAPGEHEPFPRILARAHNLLGSVALFKSDYALARHSYTQSLLTHEGSGDRRGIGAALNNLGIVALYTGDLAEAEQFQRRSLTIKEELGDQGGIATSWYNLGEVLCDKGALAHAAGFLRRARHLACRLGYAEVEALAALGSTRAYLRQGNRRKVSALLDHGLRLARAHRASRTLVYGLLLQSDLQLATDMIAEARASASDAMDLAGEINLPRHIAIAKRLLGQCAWRSGDLEAARSRLYDSLRSLRTLGASLEVARTQIALAAILIEAGLPEEQEAVDLCSAATAAFEAAGAHLDTVATARVRSRLMGEGAAC
jgi:DNA-binding SARP family transcriptional activator/tetratricopeptide (TPR) repeat protein